MLISRRARITFLVVLAGVLGGLGSGMIIGIFVGAMLLSVFYTIVNNWLATPDEGSTVTQLITDRAGEGE